MIVKSNSVPNFLFEAQSPKPIRFITLRLITKPKIASYSEFLRNNPKSTKLERRNAIKMFYDNLFSK